MHHLRDRLALRGYEQLLTEFITDPGLAEQILVIPYSYHLTAAEKLTQMGVDMIWLGDDVGMQSGMLMSPKIAQALQTQDGEFHRQAETDQPASQGPAHHSDGDIRLIIPDLIECGLDVLNPIQPACMDPAELKRLYGDKLCFWGSIDEQETLPFGTPDDVRAEVLTRLKTIGQDGGLDHRPDPSRPARHAAGQLLGDGRHDHRDALHILRIACVGLLHDHRVGQVDWEPVLRGFVTRDRVVTLSPAIRVVTRDPG